MWSEAEIPNGKGENSGSFPVLGSHGSRGFAASQFPPHQVIYLLLGFCETTVLTSLPPLFGEGNGNPLQYSCLKNPMDRGAWQATVSLWGHKESDTTEVTQHAAHHSLSQANSSCVSIILQPRALLIQRQIKYLKVASFRLHWVWTTTMTSHR